MIWLAIYATQIKEIQLLSQRGHSLQARRFLLVKTDRLKKHDVPLDYDDDDDDGDAIFLQVQQWSTSLNLYMLRAHPKI